MSIHPTAIVNPQAELDESVEVGPYCVIEANVRVGAGSRLYHGVYLTGWTTIGEACELHPGAVVGHSPQDTKYGGERSYCRIGDRCILREHVTIHRGTIPESETILGDDCFLLAGAHVAHNCRLGSGVTLINNVMLAGHVAIADHATLGGAAGVHQFVRIGELAMITGNSRVPLDVLPYAMIDTMGRVVGINRVGLRRAGFSADERAAVRDAYRTIFDAGRSFSETVVAFLDQEHAGPVATIATFLREQSRRGVAGRSRRRGRATNSDSSDA